MKVGDVVKEKYVTERVGVIIFIGHDNGVGTICSVMYTDGTMENSPPHHFWELNND